MDGLKGKIRTVGDLSGGSINRDSIHPTSAEINPIVTYQTENGRILSEDVKRVATTAFLNNGSIKDTNTQYKIVQDIHNKYKFTLWRKENTGREWRLQDEVIIPRTLITTGRNKGTIAVNGEDVPVKGLTQTAFTDINYFVNKYTFQELEREVKDLQDSLVWEDV